MPLQKERANRRDTQKRAVELKERQTARSDTLRIDTRNVVQTNSEWSATEKSSSSGATDFKSPLPEIHFRPQKLLIHFLFTKQKETQTV